MNCISWLILALLAGIQGQLLWRIWKLNMLPHKYFLILAALMLVLTFLVGFLLFRKKEGKWQKKSGYGRQILGYLLSAVMICVCLIGSTAVGRVLGTIDAITAPEKISVVLEVYVRSDDPAEYIQDTAGYSYAMSEDVPQEITAEMLVEMEKLLGTSLEVRYYPGAVAALDALLAGEVEAVILDSAYLSVLDSMEGYEDIGDKIKMLHEHVIEKEIPPETKPEKPKVNEPGDVTTEPFLLYISGNDARRELLADGGSDVNILVAVNPKNHQILLVNTPRDYYVVNPASGNGSRDKLSHCGLRGIDNCISAVEGLYGISIDYYARINFSGFRTLIDAIGGVTVYSDRAFSAGNTYIRQGENYLNGAQALSFARERKNLPGGDNDRGKNQMKLISAMIQQLSVGNLISNYAEILKSLEGMFTTSLPAQDIGKLVQLQLTQMPSWEVLSFAVTGDNGTNSCWAVGGGYGYVMYPHEHMVEHAVDLMRRVLSGDVLTQEDLIVNP